MELEDITQSLGYCIARLTEKMSMYEWTIKGLKNELEWYKSACEKNNIIVEPDDPYMDSDTEEDTIEIDLQLPAAPPPAISTTQT